MRIIILAVVAYLVYQMIKRTMRSKGDESLSQGASGEEMVLDSVCKSYIPRESALRVRRGDEVYYFCGEECRKEFIASLKEGD